ncbi:MAG TPA: DMT family transporter [Hyphomicrobiaceae bacterium]|nr:DMT family transporter [Hyphomicrobiaceae bacterium]
MSRLHADFALLLAAVVWGVAFLFQKSAMEHVGPLTFIAARGWLAAVALAPLAWREHRRVPNQAGHAPGWGLWVIALWGGVAFFVAAWLQQEGIKTATVTNTGFLTALYVVLTPFVAWAWSGKVPSPAVWPAVALSALGTWLLGGGTLSALSTGDRLVAASALFWAIHVVITGRAAPFRRPMAFTAAQFAVVGVVSAVGSALIETTTLPGLAGAALDILYVGLLSSALTFTILTVALQYTPPSEAAVIVSMETLFAALAAYLMLGERLTAIGWLGSMLILSATLLLQVGAAIGMQLGRARAKARPDR